MTGYSRIAFDNEVIADVLHVPDHDIKKRAFAGRLKMRTGRLDKVTRHIKLVCFMKIRPTLVTVLYRKIRIKVPVLILRFCNYSDHLVELFFERGVR